MTKRYSYLLYILCALFLALFAMLSWHSRLASDDYCFIWEVYNYGAIKSTYLDYMSWCGRYAAKFFFYLIYESLDVDQTYYFLLPLLSLGLILLGVYKSITNITARYNTSISFLSQLALATSFTALLFFTTIDIGETWFWYNSFGDYLWSVIAFIWGMAFLFSKSNRLIDSIAAALCFIYIGGASEIYSLVYGQLFLWLIYKGLKKYNYKISDFLKDEQYRKIAIIAALFLLSFLITVLAPGNYARASNFPTPHFISTIRLSAYMFGKLLLWFLPQKIVYIIAFASPFLIVGKQYHQGNVPSLKVFFNKIRMITLFFLINCLLVFGLIAFLMTQSGEYRIWFILSFLLTVYCCGIAFCIGFSGLLNDKKTEILKKASITIGFTVLIFTIINQYIIAKKYALAHDERVTFLIRTNEQIQKDTTVVLPLLPPSGMLYSAEITNNVDHFSNKELRRGYRLKYNVISEKKVP